MKLEIEGNRVILYSDDGGRLLVLGDTFNTDENIRRVVYKAIEFGRQVAKREIRDVLGCK